jgi:acyl carrier protein
MTRDHIQAVVVKHLCEAVDGLKAEQVDASKSMKDLGANSLDIVEVVSSSMREIKIKIPRSELAKITTLQGLVDVLHQAASEKAAAEKPA